MKKSFAVSGIVIRELYRRKDFYVLFIMTVVITLIMGSLNFFDDKQIGRYLKDICLLLIWISMLVIAVTMAARQIPYERENRTIFPLLAKPITRSQVLVGKFLGCWLATGIALCVFYVFFAVVGASQDRELSVARYAQVLWMQWQMLAIVISLTILGSVAVSTPAANVTIVFVLTLGIMFVGGHLNLVAAQLTGVAGSVVYAIYYVIPHLEFFDLRNMVIHNQALVAFSDILLASLYAQVYTAVFLLIACLMFKRKALN